MWGMSSIVRGDCGVDDDGEGGAGVAYSGVAYNGTANAKILFCLGITGRTASDLTAFQDKKERGYGRLS